jgi:hypothetical protein
MPPDDFSPSTESDITSPEHTPTIFNRSYSANPSPTGLLTQWTAHQCADWVAALGLGLEKYGSRFIGTFCSCSQVEKEGLLANMIAP